MKTDRELLELAAKAAGISIKYSNRWANTVVIQVTLDDGSLNWVRWNPLTDDGDALRLAVTLGLEIINDGYMVVVRTRHPHKFGAQESLNGDCYAATRRAIVRAAAAIGEHAGWCINVGDENQTIEEQNDCIT